jgi:hypothetical protein
MVRITMPFDSVHFFYLIRNSVILHKSVNFVRNFMKSGNRKYTSRSISIRSSIDKLLKKRLVTLILFLNSQEQTVFTIFFVSNSADFIGNIKSYIDRAVGYVSARRTKRYLNSHPRRSPSDYFIFFRDNAS